MADTKKIVKQIKNYVFLISSISLACCNGQNKSENLKNSETEKITVPQKENNTNIFNPATTTSVDKSIRSIFQDKNGTYWFGTNGTGVYRYNTRLNDAAGQAKRLDHFTVKDGLSNNQVLSIQEDDAGNIWFGTGIFGVSKFDGRNFTTVTNKENLKLSNGSVNKWKTEPNDLWFYAGGGVFRYNHTSFVYLPLDELKEPTNSPFNLSRFAVYSILKDKKGNVWFGTQAQGVCRYDPSASLRTSGNSFTWFTEKGLSGSAVLALFEDSEGNFWFGNNGAGLFKYDGKTLINFTEEKGLTNNEFKVSGKSGPGTLARVYAINEDNFGNIWIGTVDAGVWKYDGNYLTNYTTKDGLTSNAVNTIYKDKNGELWFGTDGDGVCKFNGNTFTEFVIN